VEGAVENLISSLGRLGITFDEGPETGGDYGPYYQSDRLEIYKKYCEQLLASGHAYYAFETQEELDEMRRLQQLEGKQTMYDRRGRDLSEDEVKEKLASDAPRVIRLKVPLGEEVRFNDLVKGNIKIDTDIVDDQILLKSDGFPTYHLANVVDDHLMQITHIIRGEEWITSVPKHILIYRALGWEVPQMAHVPLILNPDKSKLSKRQGDVAVEDYLQKGYLKEALVNFIALLGWNPGEGEEKEFFSMDELTKAFTLDKVQTSGAVFNIDKLNWMNNSYIKNYDIDKLAEISKPFFEVTGIDTGDSERLKKILSAIRVYLNKLNEIPDHVKIFIADEVVLEDEKLKDLLTADSSKIAFASLSEKIAALEILNAENYKSAISEVQADTGVKGKALFKPVRIALTGSENGPELPAIAEILGKDKVIEFLKRWH
jgi:glutamyl-tRNA synthetase